MNQNYRGDLTEAWLGRVRAAGADLSAAAQAPALFSPAFVEKRQAAFDEAMKHLRFSYSQAVTE